MADDQVAQARPRGDVDLEFFLSEYLLTPTMEWMILFGSLPMVGCALLVVVIGPAPALQAGEPVFKVK